MWVWAACDRYSAYLTNFVAYYPNTLRSFCWVNLILTSCPEHWGRDWLHMPLRLFSPRRVLNFLDVILFQIWRTLCPRCLKVSETAFWNKKLAIFLLELKEFCSPHVRAEFGLGCSHSDLAVLKLLRLSKANVHIGTLHGLTSAAGSHAGQTLLECSTSQW